MHKIMKKFNEETENRKIGSLMCVLVMLGALVVLAAVQSTPALGVLYVIDYTNSSTTSMGLSSVTRMSQANSISEAAYFELRTLQYDPFPVNPGEWFDLWVKVQNVGNEDATNTTFQLVEEYPFSLSSSDSPVKYYGIIPGVASAFKNKLAGDTTIQANQVILKYRVKVADNAPEGDAVIKIRAMAGNKQGDWFPFDLLISVANTKTDFDVITQDSTTQGTSFAIANTGQNTATAVIVSIEPMQGMNATGSTSSILGNLAAGDYTTVSFQISSMAGNRTASGSAGSRTQTNPNSFNRSSLQQPGNFTRQPNQVTMKITYTDTAGIRNTVEKTVQLSSAGQRSASAFSTGTRTQSAGLPGYLYLLIGVILGVLIVYIYHKMKQRKKKQ
ncbi:MAG: hypothetical protein NT001_04145 [Candidatus Woesearchaeota archaeon]|nr:hypothetical protein [Candidatus Woesearchaeota archaeon]